MVDQVRLDPGAPTSVSLNGNDGLLSKVPAGSGWLWALLLIALGGVALSRTGWKRRNKA